MDFKETITFLIIKEQKILRFLQEYLIPSELLNLISTSKILQNALKNKAKEIKYFIIDTRFKTSFKLSKNAKEDFYKIDLLKEKQKILAIFNDANLLPSKDQLSIKCAIPLKFRDPNFFRIFYSPKANKFVSLYRCWVDQSLNFEDQETIEEQKDYHLMIEKINYQNSFGTDDSKSLFLKHKQLQEELRKKETVVIADEELTFPFISEAWKKFAILMFHGGDFTFAVFENMKEVMHVSDHKYIVRKKGGGKQSSKDGQKSIKSIGSQIRRENEKNLNINIENMIVENGVLLQSCHLIFVYSPGMNILKIVSCIEKAGVSTKKIRSIGLSSQKAKYAEIVNIFAKITKVIVG